jgi:fused signal recognition particle receptor
MTPEQLIVLAVVLVAVIIVVVRVMRPQAPGPADEATLLGLDKTKTALATKLHRLFGTMGPGFWEGLEDAMISADVGVVATSEIVGRVRARRPDGPSAALQALREELVSELGDRARELRLAGTPSVVVVVGVNGSGKTTTIAKLAASLADQGKRALLGAADTFRAAADMQLRAWAERVGVEVVSGQDGADPASVAFSAYEAARARGADVVIVDTAGRLQSKRNLMQELEKIVRVLGREADGVDEVLLVLDATNGQNAIAQARVFTESVGVTGIALTKLDGTARGGVVIAIERELGIPVKLIGVGEGPRDLVPFVPSDFVDAILEDV